MADQETAEAKKMAQAKRKQRKPMLHIDDLRVGMFTAHWFVADFNPDWPLHQPPPAAGIDDPANRAVQQLEQQRFNRELLPLRGQPFQFKSGLFEGCSYDPWNAVFAQGLCVLVSARDRLSEQFPIESVGLSQLGIATSRCAQPSALVRCYQLLTEP